MQEGDLADGPLPDILRLLAAARATGGVHVRRRDERGESADAVLFLREGRLYAATAPGPRPLLGVRLVAAGAVTRAALEEALESQAGELAGWRLGELLVHLGYVDGEIVAEFVVEQILDTVAEVSAWVAGGWRFRRGEKTREADGLSLDIEDVLERVAVRRQSWNHLEEYAGGATAVPQRVEVDEALTTAQIPLVQALLGEVDGVRTLAELATRCGLTTYEAGYVLAQLVEVGAVRLAPRGEPTAAEPPAPPVTTIVAALAVPLATPVLPGPAVAAPAPAGAGPSTGVEPVDFDAADPLGLADLLDRPSAATTDAPVRSDEASLTASADDELAALLGGGSSGGGQDEVDLATQLAVLARQAEEARWAAEARHREEVRARRTARLAETFETAEPTEPTEPTEPAEPAEPGDPTAASGTSEPLVAPHEPIGLAPYEPIGLAPYEPIGLAPVEPNGISAVDPEAPTDAAVIAPVLPDQDPEPAQSAEADPDPAARDADLPPLGGGLPMRSASAAAEPADLPGALADLRGAIDLAALDDPEPVRTDEALRTIAASAAAEDLQRAADRSALQRAFPESDADESAHTGAVAAEPGWVAVASAWSPDEGHDFTPDQAEPSTDTAALLRELSFLGLEDLPPAPGPTPPRTPAPRQAPAPAPAGKPKRKSIFGR